MKKQAVWTKKQKFIWGVILVAAWCLIGLIFYKTNGGLTVEQLVTYKPKNPVAAALAMLGLFALKSVDFIMHSGVLYAASGVMFPLPHALALNIVGDHGDALLFHWQSPRHADPGGAEEKIPTA